MKKIIIICLMALCGPIFGQNLTTISKIKLKDGSDLTVTILENHPGKFIKVKITEGQTSVINYSEIESIRDKSYRYNSHFILPKGFYMEGAYAFMFGKSGTTHDMRIGLSLGVIANYRFNTFISVGAGVDLNALYVNSNHLLFPVYGRLSGSLSKKRVAPYYILDVGWSSASMGERFEEDYEIKGGLLIRPEVGIRINKVRIGLGYQMQNIHTSYTSNFWWGDQQFIEEERVMRNIRMGVSIIF